MLYIPKLFRCVSIIANLDSSRNSNKFHGRKQVSGLTVAGLVNCYRSKSIFHSHDKLFFFY